MRSRLRAAWKAFRDNPDHTWVVAQNVVPLGWRLEFRSHSRASCEAWLVEHIIPEDVFEEVMTWTEYRERQIALLESSAPWMAVARLQQLNNELAAEMGIGRAQEFVNHAKRGIDDEWMKRYTKRRA